MYRYTKMCMPVWREDIFKKYMYIINIKNTATRKALEMKKKMLCKISNIMLKHSAIFFCDLFIKQQHFSKILNSHAQKMYNNMLLISFDNYDRL